MSSKDLKIVYYLGAGASYNSVPILNKQGYSMIDMSEKILNIVNGARHIYNPEFKELNKNENLIALAEKLNFYGEKSKEYGSIDIYARRLFLLKKDDQLEELKYCLSVYFDLWENFLFHGVKLNSEKFYDKIDKRYLALLSVLLQRTDSNPKLNSSVTFISWNYDLQLEMAYESFMNTERNSLIKINDNFNFMGVSSKGTSLDVIHLNGYRGIVESEDKFHEIIDREKKFTLEGYLLGLLDFDNKFNPFGPSYQTQIKYAWEKNSNAIEEAKKVMSAADVLVIIGYSFPSFNRGIDTELIREFEDNGINKKVIYQDPGASQDIVDSIFLNKNKVIVKKDTPLQFYMPHEYLFPKDIKSKSFMIGPSVG